MLWIAHALTLLRVPLAVLVAIDGAHDRALAVAAIVAAAASDAADGNVARFLKRRGHTRFDIGGWLDPLADKIFVLLVLVAVVRRTDSLAFGVLVGARELLFVPLAAAYFALRGRRHAPLHADAVGKLATIAQFVAVALALGLADPRPAFAAAIVAAALGIATVVHYVRTRLLQ